MSDLGRIRVFLGVSKVHISESGHQEYVDVGIGVPRNPEFMFIACIRIREFTCSPVSHIFTQKSPVSREEPDSLEKTASSADIAHRDSE